MVTTWPRTIGVADQPPGRRLAFEAIAGPVRPTGTYQLEATTDGTRLTFALAADLAGIKKLLIGGAVQKTIDAKVASHGTFGGDPRKFPRPVDAPRH